MYHSETKQKLIHICVRHSNIAMRLYTIVSFKQPACSYVISSMTMLSMYVLDTIIHFTPPKLYLDHFHNLINKNIFMINIIYINKLYTVIFVQTFMYPAAPILLVYILLNSTCIYVYSRST